MKKAYMVFVLISSISHTFADKLSLNWSSDIDTLPKALPKKLSGKSDDEIQKAVFQAYEIQLKVISEYSGHVLDPEFPYGYFKDEMPISNTRTSNLQSDLIFYNNAIRGFIGQNKNSVIIKWASDQVVTEIEWNELSVRGRYTFMNSSYFDQGKYLIQLQNLKYLASTTLSENTEAYPSTVPKSSISYKNIKASFTGGLPEVLKTSDSSNVKHYVEDIIFQQVADRIVRDTHNNITVAIRQAIKPYIIFKNDTDLTFPGLNITKQYAKGVEVYNITNPLISGFANIEQKLKKVTTKMATNTVTVDLRMTIHNLDGKFDYKPEESKPSPTATKPYKATFAITRIDVNVSFNLLKPVECKTEIIVNKPTVKFGSKISEEIEKTISSSFFETIKNQLNSNICKFISQAI